MVFASINVNNLLYILKKSPIDVRSLLYKSILISGGTTMFPGFPTRLLNDMTKIYKKEILKGKEGGSKVKIDILVVS